MEEAQRKIDEEMKKEKSKAKEATSINNIKQDDSIRIFRKIHQEFENQLREEYDKKMSDELSYIRKKEAFNQKIKMEQIDNAIKEIAKKVINIGGKKNGKDILRLSKVEKKSKCCWCESVLRCW